MSPWLCLVSFHIVFWKKIAAQTVENVSVSCLSLFIIFIYIRCRSNKNSCTLALLCTNTSLFTLVKTNVLCNYCLAAHWQSSLKTSFHTVFFFFLNQVIFHDKSIPGVSIKYWIFCLFRSQLQRKVHGSPGWKSDCPVCCCAGDWTSCSNCNECS